MQLYGPAVVKSMSKEDMQNEIAAAICKKEEGISCEECFRRGGKEVCIGFDKCRISEKTEEQLKYVLSSIDKNTFLKACAGSGKTEVVGMKAAYEISKWDKYTNKGIAILTFTNDATDVIRDRISQFNNLTSTYPHFVGTFSSFVHQYIAQPFGYLYEGYKPDTNDHSFRLIDKELSMNGNPWLISFKSKYVYATDKDKKIFFAANNISMDNKLGGCYVFISKNITREFKKDVNRKEIKNFHEEKSDFHKHGFANFDDMNNIAYKVLFSSKPTCEIIAKKFPIIIVDECQDLSWIEMQILKKLMNVGSIIHFIGDLNQSIWEFKRVDPQDTREFVRGFKTLSLTDNFRCCDPIVSFTNKLVPDCGDIESKCENKLNVNSLLYTIYEAKNEIELIKKYKAILKKFNIEEENSCIIAKQNTMVDKLSNQEESTALLISALQLWISGNAVQKKRALEYAGKQISRWFGGSRTSKNYFCPKDITSVYRWRIFLKDVLTDCCSKGELIDFDKKYSKWYKQAKELLPEIVRARYIRLKEFDDSKTRDFNDAFSGSWFNSPNGLGKERISIMTPNDSESNIPVKTVHDSKGCTYDSAMVVSSKDRKSDLGHWKEHWLNGSDEGKRVGYVASTRAKYLLVWAIPSNKKLAEDRKCLEGLGFKDAELVLE